MSSKATEGRLRLSILLGYNLPFLFWTCWAGLLAVTDLQPAWHCPVRMLFHVCPGCGLTSQYSGFLRGHPPGLLLLIVLSIFLLNAAWSVFSALRKRGGPA